MNRLCLTARADQEIRTGGRSLQMTRSWTNNAVQEEVMGRAYDRHAAEVRGEKSDSVLPCCSLFENDLTFFSA
eukprot:768267-Hanusia_phi.AAC.7